MATSTSTTLPASRKLQRAGNRCSRYEQRRKIESGQQEKGGRDLLIWQASKLPYCLCLRPCSLRSSKSKSAVHNCNWSAELYKARPAQVAIVSSCYLLPAADDDDVILLIWLRLQRTDNNSIWHVLCLIIDRNRRAKFLITRLSNRLVYNSIIHLAQLHHPHANSNSNLFYFSFNWIEAHLSCERVRVLHAFITN